MSGILKFSMNTQLPEDRRLNTAALSSIFSSTSTSYKYLFFLGLLDCLTETQFSELIFSIDTVIGHMLKRAWYPHKQFRLNFGNQDRIASIIDDLGHRISYKGDPPATVIETLIAGLNRLSLDRFVPLRLIRPFFSQELRGKKDHLINNAIRKLAHTQFNKLKPLYMFNDDFSALIMHQEWLAYLYYNFGIVESWALWNWSGYLQSRNPTVPAIAAKLSRPPDRFPLTSEWRYWNNLLQSKEGSGLKCLYSSQGLRGEKKALDHYIPWSYVGHNQIWNLVPVLFAANSSKLDSVPSKDYIDGFSDMQYKLIAKNAKVLSDTKWKNFAEPYVHQLHIPYSELGEYRKVGSAFKAILSPLGDLAARSGFPNNWVYAGES